MPLHAVNLVVPNVEGNDPPCWMAVEDQGSPMPSTWSIRRGPCGRSSGFSRTAGPRPNFWSGSARTAPRRACPPGTFDPRGHFRRPVSRSCATSQLTIGKVGLRDSRTAHDGITSKGRLRSPHSHHRTRRLAACRSMRTGTPADCKTGGQALPRSAADTIGAILLRRVQPISRVSSGGECGAIVSSVSMPDGSRTTTKTTRTRGSRCAHHVSSWQLKPQPPE